MSSPSARPAAAMSGGVDVHAHLFPREFAEDVHRVSAELGSPARLDSFDGAALHMPELSDPAGERLRLMDEAGIERQLLSYSAPHLYHPVAEARVRIARSWNDATSAAVAASGGRLSFFATLPLPFVEASLAEIDRAGPLPGRVGFGLPTHVDGRALDDPAWCPVFDRLDQSAELLFVHPDGFCAPGLLADHGMEWSIGAPFEDTIAALRLVQSGTLDRCPALRVIVPHLGGTLAFLLPRIDHHSGGLAGTPGRLAGDHAAPTRPVPSEGLRKIYFDTAQSTPAMLALAAETLGADHLVFGTDFPYVARTDMRPSAADLLTLGEDMGAPIFQARTLFGG